MLKALDKTYQYDLSSAVMMATIQLETGPKTVPPRLIAAHLRPHRHHALALSRQAQRFLSFYHCFGPTPRRAARTRQVGRVSPVSNVSAFITVLVRTRRGIRRPGSTNRAPQFSMFINVLFAPPPSGIEPCPCCSEGRHMTASQRERGLL